MRSMIVYIEMTVQDLRAVLGICECLAVSEGQGLKA